MTSCWVLQGLPKGISALRSLRVLDLEGNKLEYLATEISEERGREGGGGGREGEGRREGGMREGGGREGGGREKGEGGRQ